MEAVGNYAVKLAFDDMHDTGIFGWSYLYDLGREYRNRWGEYLRELDTLGLNRERAASAPAKGGQAEASHGSGSCGSGCGCH